MFNNLIQYTMSTSKFCLILYHNFNLFCSARAQTVECNINRTGKFITNHFSINAMFLDNVRIIMLMLYVKTDILITDNLKTSTVTYVFKGFSNKYIILKILNLQ